MLEESRRPGSPSPSVLIPSTTLDLHTVLGHMCCSSFHWEEMGLSPRSPHPLLAWGGFQFGGFYRPLTHSTLWTPAEREEGEPNLPGYSLWDLITCYYLEEMLNISAPRAKQPTVRKQLNFWRDCFSISGTVLTAHGGGEGLATLE